MIDSKRKKQPDQIVYSGQPKETGINKIETPQIPDKINRIYLNSILKRYEYRREKLEMKELQQTIKRNNPQEINKLLNEIKKTPLEVKFKSGFPSPYEVDCYILSEFKKRLLMTPKELELYELEIKRKSLEIKLEQKEFEKRRRLLDIYFDNNQKSKKN